MAKPQIVPMDAGLIEISPRNVHKIGSILADVRVLSKISQTDLSKKIKKAQSFVSNVETKVKSPGLKTTVSYLDKLGYKLLIVKK